MMFDLLGFSSLSNHFQWILRSRPDAVVTDPFAAERYLAVSRLTSYHLTQGRRGRSA